jgi:hypothetical protein
MTKVSDALDRLTQTFSMDRAYCDALMNSASASAVAELLISHQWANSALPLCYKGLAAAVGQHFGARSENATFWNFILLDGVNRDLRLVPYLVLRGVASEASAALRRALEHVGVLTHIWMDPEKVDALRDTDSKEYSQAFRREVDERKAKALRDSKTAKRFAAMKLGSVATLLYDTLSVTDVHGGTSARFVLYADDPSDLVCSFTMRPDPSAERTIQQIRFLTDGHRATCLEMMSLCGDYAAPSEELAAAAETFKMFASVAGDQTPELRQHVAQLLNRLGVALS